MPVLSVAIDARPATTGASKADRAFKKLKTGAKGARGELDKFDKKNKELEKSTKSVTSSLGQFVTVLAAVAAAKDAIRTIADFEQSMVTLGAVAGATGDQLEALEVTARKLGATTRFSATEAADGLLFLARAGFETEEAIAALPATLDLATTGAIELGEAADVASNILSGFGLEAKETSRVVDSLVNVSNRANTSVAQLAQAFVDVAPIAKAAGQSLEETASQLGVLGDSGIQGSKAGVALRGILLSLENPSVKARKAFRSLGLDLDEFNKQGVSATEILRRFVAAGADLPRAANVFNTRFAGAALIIGEAANRVDELTEAQKENRGAAEEQARVMADTLGGAFKSLISATEEFILSIGDSGAAGSLKNMVEAVTDGIRFLLGLQDSLSGTAQRAAAVAATLKAISIFIGAIIAFKFTAVIIGMSKAMFALAKGSAAAAISTAPLLTIFASLVALAAGIVIGKTLFNEFKIAQEAAAAFAEFFLNIVERIRFGWNTGVSQLTKIWVTFTSGFKIAWSEAERFIENGILDVASFFNKNLDVSLARKFVDDKANQVLKDSLKDIVDAEKKANAEIIADALESGVRLNAIRKNANEEFLRIQKEFGKKQSKGDIFKAAKKSVKELITGINELNLGLDLTSKASFDVAISFDKMANSAGKIPDSIEKTNNGLDEVLKKLKDANETMGQMEKTGQIIGSGIADGLTTALFQAKSLREVLNETGRQITQQIAKQAIAQAITTGISAGFSGGTQTNAEALQSAGAQTQTFSSAGTNFQSANGNVFNQGNIQQFQNGGVVNTPTLFNQANGKLSSMSEVGPEAILPLKRKNGKLGVSSDGGGGTTVNNNINFTVNATDANSFKQSRSQILGDLQAGLANA